MGHEDQSTSGEEFWENRWKTGETPWDHGAPAPPFTEFVERHGPPPGEILIPGCGSGCDVYYFAGLGVKVTGLDISPTAIGQARSRNGHANAHYHIGDFLNPPKRLHRRFDWVLEHTCLCAMPPELWPRYAEALKKVLKPGGHYLAIFYRDPDDEAGPPFRIEEETINGLFGKDFNQLERWRPTRSYESRVGLEEVRWYIYQ